MSAKPFLDTNIIVYAFTAGDARRDPAEDLVASGGVVSVQVLNEFVNVSLRKRKRSWTDLLAELHIIEGALQVVPLILDTHREAREIARRFSFSFYDSLLVSAARQAGCRILYSEDLQHGQIVDGVEIRNPFLAA